MNDLEKVLEAQNATVIAAKEEHEALRQSSLAAIASWALGGSGNAAHSKAIELALGNVYSADELRELLEVALRALALDARAKEHEQLEELANKALTEFVELRDKRMEELKAFSTRAQDAKNEAHNAQQAGYDLHHLAAKFPDLFAQLRAAREALPQAQAKVKPKPSK